MKQVISENDYEKYRILVPVKFFMNGKSRKYISSRLEKLHPCFSDNFCFDSKYRLSKKGLVANVVVMDKLKLWDYKANYPGLVLTCEEKGSGAVFVSAKTKALITSLFCVPLLGILVFSSVNPVKNGGNQSEKNLVSKNGSDLTTVVGNRDEILSDNVNTPFAYENFFDSLENNGGKIDLINWKYDGFTEQLSVSVRNCYPESFSSCGFSVLSDREKFQQTTQNVSFSNISYKDNEPSFSMSLINRKLAHSLNQSVGIGMTSNVTAVDSITAVDEKGDLDFRSNIRELLKMNSIKVTSENYLPYKIRFQISEKNIGEKLLEKIEEISKLPGWYVNEVSVSMASPYLADMEISFTDDFCYAAEKSVLSCIEDSWKNFPLESQPKDKNSSTVDIQKSKDSSNARIKVLAMSGEKNPISNGKKLGTITHANGETVVFYKSDKGVITND